MEQTAAFDYNEYWDGQDEQTVSHETFADRPIIEQLVPFSEAVRTIGARYNLSELAEEGIDVEAMLKRQSLQQVLDYLELEGIEESISPMEAFATLKESTEGAILLISSIYTSHGLRREIEDGVDISAFNTHDFERDFSFEFDAEQYAAQKVLEQVHELAILHSSISSEEGKQAIRERYISFATSRYGDYAKALRAKAARVQGEERNEVLGKLSRVNSHIRQMRMAWYAEAYRP